MNRNTTYSQNIRSRSKFRFLKGLYPRTKKYLIQAYINWVARKNGATVGVCVTMPYGLAKKANSNLIIGDHTSIQTDKIELRRATINIGSNVIIGSDVQILNSGHNIDSPDWEMTCSELIIEDFVWVATAATILPSCNRIKYGTVIAAKCVLHRDAEKMSVFGGNPAKFLRVRKEVHTDLVVEGMQGNDLIAYWKAYKK